MTQVLLHSWNTVRLRSARAVLTAWVVLAVVAMLVLGSTLIAHPPARTVDAVKTRCHVVSLGLDCSKDAAPTR